MSRSSVKIGSILMHAMGWFTLVMALLWVFITEIMFVSDFLAYTGQTYADYLAANPVFAEIYIITKRLVGFVLLGVALQILFITKYGYEKGEKWAWVALLIAGGLLWGTLIGYRAFIGYLGGSTIAFVAGAVLYALGILIPAREIWSKEPS
ncbi:MAG: hypothetical protein JSW61_08530 [Candidatus Thorarchaeota archaeon]|nr:MAG: hypothetical protein JSW61_08530 [Candidatus Thorarchaeota archaeon]